MRDDFMGFSRVANSSHLMSSGHPGLYNLAFSPEDESIVFAATAKGLLQSKDSGENWTVISPGNLTGLTVMGNEKLYFYDETNELLYFWNGDESEEIAYPNEHGPIIIQLLMRRNS